MENSINIGPVKRIKDAVIHPINTRLELFLKTRGKKYTSLFDGTTINYWLPDNREVEFDVVPFLQTAVERNKEIFGKIPDNVEFIFVNSTKDYNQVSKIMHPITSRFYGSDKRKGDWEKGCRISANKVLIFDYGAFESETDLGSYGFSDSEKKQDFLGLLTHELNHVAQGDIVSKAQGLNPWSIIPSWVEEGLAYLVGKQSTSLNSKHILELINGLDEHGKIPTNKELRKDEKGDGPIVYSYSFQLIRWLFANHTISKFPLALTEVPDKGIYDTPRIKLMVDVVRSIGSGHSFDDAFTQSFGISYPEAHKGFLTYLNGLQLE